MPLKVWKCDNFQLDPNSTVICTILANRLFVKAKQWNIVTNVYDVDALFDNPFLDQRL